jgi:hypothetical protein
MSEPKLDARLGLAFGLQSREVSELPLVLDGDNPKPKRFKVLHELIPVRNARKEVGSISTFPIAPVQSTSVDVVDRLAAFFSATCFPFGLVLTTAAHTVLVIASSQAELIAVDVFAFSHESTGAMKWT